MEKQVEYGVFMPVGEGGWIRSTTAPTVPATYAYNRQVAILAEQLGLDFLLAMAQQLQAAIEAGDFDGLVLTFPDFIEDLRFFGERVLPLLTAAGFAQPLARAV
jgi:alkanesulfonate monooxygenase SsuD/methylene tetrahydromethanopterin reductase-like flavin-dependent oxidoreductase (luciferase family)